MKALVIQGKEHLCSIYPITYTDTPTYLGLALRDPAHVNPSVKLCVKFHVILHSGTSGVILKYDLELSDRQ